MWDMLTWHGLRNPETAEAVAGLRAETLRLFVRITTAGYLLVMFVSTISVSPDNAPRIWVTAPVVAIGLLGTYLLDARSSRVAAAYFLVLAVVEITAAIWFLNASVMVFVYPVVVLAAVVLWHPLAGVIVSGQALGALLVTQYFGPAGLVDENILVGVAAASLLTVVAASALGWNMVIAVEWSLDSYAQAQRNADDARRHRAQLVDALKQLDHAYYRLQQANAALEIAWRAAESAERSKTEFVTNISHELRTPLNLIHGFSELILTAPESYGATLPVAFRGDLNAIYRATQHLLSLTDDVLDMARVGIGRLALNREIVDLRLIVQEAEDLVRNYVRAKGLWLRVEVGPDVPPLELDRLRIRQVVLNLLTNAIRFTDHGGITIAIAREGGKVVVQLSDTGSGIAADRLPRIFDEFVHFDSPGNSVAVPGGFGLGLPISKRLVELHGGEILVTSTPGLGTTFCFMLPCQPAEGVVASEGRQPLRSSNAAWYAERCVVLAGGDRRLADFFERHLRGYRVVEAADRQEAIERANDAWAIAILEDSDASARNDAVSPTPIVRVPLPSRNRVARALGASAYLIKPVLRADLATAIEGLGSVPGSVLVVDDDLRFTRLLTRMLRAGLVRAGGEIRTAHDGQEALALLSTFQPDLIIADLKMPTMGGDALVRAMADVPSLASIPTILVSAHDTLDLALKTGGLLIVERPDGFRVEEILGLTEAVLSGLAPSHPGREFPLTNRASVATS